MPDANLLSLGPGLLCILSKEFLVVITGQSGLVVGWPQDGPLKVIAPLAITLQDSSNIFLVKPCIRMHDLPYAHQTCFVRTY